MFSEARSNCLEHHIIRGVNLWLYGRMLLSEYVKVDLFSHL